MPQSKHKKRHGDQKRKPKQKKGGGPRRRKEIVFDPEARKDYLRGFSERKRQRRAYGLAMQKVKDRKAKLEERKEVREAEMERVEEAERQKEKMIVERFGGTVSDENDVGGGGHNDGDDGNQDQVMEDGDMNDGDEGYGVIEKLQQQAETTRMYKDATTQSKWGGQVIVTTSCASILSDDDGSGGDDSDDDDDDDDDDQVKPSRKRAKYSVDEAQVHAGHVNKYLDQLKGNMPGRKNRDNGYRPKKGRHGAENMKGIGGATNLKMAQKMLSKAQGGKGGGGKNGGAGGDRGKRKGKRGRRT